MAYDISMQTRLTLFCGFLLMMGACSSSKPPRVNPITLAPQPSKDIVGVWALVNKVTDVPISGSRLKFILDNRWSLTQADTTTGAVLYHHGGSYTFDGKTYTEQVEFANPNTASYIKSTASFTVQIEGNVLTLTGIGNPWNEIWVRLKSN